MKNFKYSLPVLLFLISSCETYFELEIPDNEQRLVINALLEPSSPVYVHVSISNSILEEGEFELVKDATVAITEDGGTAYPLDFVESNEYGPNSGWYSTEAFDPQPGKTYTVEVSKTGFNTATSVTKIPLEPVIKSFSYIPLTESSQDSQVEFNLVFDDQAGENFYEIELYYKGIREVVDNEGNTVEYHYGQFAYLYSKNPAYDRDHRNEPGIIVNDLLFDQQEASMDFQTHIPPGVELELKVYLREITKESFRYDVSSSLQRGNRGDPLSQPVQVFSNINNGFGILKARASTYLEDAIFVFE